jgi:hypothetical protein
LAVTGGTRRLDVAGAYDDPARTTPRRRDMTTRVQHALLAVATMFLAGCATMGAPAPLAQGDWVIARWNAEDPHWYPAIVTGREGDQLALQYDDGDIGVQEARNVRPFTWAAGSRVECRWQGGDSWYRGTIAEMAADRFHINVDYDDGDKEATDTSKCREP